jgi:NAD(P)-dependent dehydrogenase (short-subunit alcohol dehydrogenase family)
MGKLDDKVAIVTGGSQGIGAATALALADEGADVALSYSSSAVRAAYPHGHPGEDPGTTTRGVQVSDLSSCRPRPGPPLWPPAPRP